MATYEATSVSFKTDILPLFTSIDIEHMTQQDPSVPLDDYTYMSNPDDDHANANAVYAMLEAKTMPPNWGGGLGPWSDTNIALFKSWMDGGYQP